MMQLVSEADIEARLDYPSLIDRLCIAFTQDCTAPLRHQHRIPTPGGGPATMLLKPAWRQGGPIAVKIINVFPDNAARGLPTVLGSVLVFDGETGETLAVIDGRALTIRRTAAASALAARYLARADAAHLLIVGTGQLAPALAQAHATVRPVERISVWGRTRHKAVATARALRADGLPATPVPDLEPAARAADIVSCATMTRDPLIRGDWLRPGTHLDLVGGFTPEMREADDQAVRRARIFVDTREGALAEAGDLLLPIASGAIGASDVVAELAELCTGAASGRSDESEITLFKSVGTALEDLAAAELALERGAN